MAVHKVQVNFALDGILARDHIVNTFYLDTHGVVPDDNDGLAQDVLDLFQTLYNSSNQIEVNLYDVGGSPPHFPVGHAIENEGNAPIGSSSPREVALCLSYYGERNLPRTRGRMYICAAGASAFPLPGLRPAPAARTALLDLADGISGLGGANVDWVTHSSIAGQANEIVQHAWVDDEWDTQRRRGLRATTRDSRAVSG